MVYKWNKDIAEEKLQSSEDSVVCAFQRVSAESWFDLPYISVIIFRNSRLPEEELKKIRSGEKNLMLIVLVQHR
jgi:hypothetical protein